MFFTKNIHPINCDLSGFAQTIKFTKTKIPKEVIPLITGRVLLLNFSYEPLGTIGVARAICMQFCEKLYIEELDGDNVLHSPSTTIPVPSVVRLRHYVHVKRQRRENTMKRVRIYIRDRYRCQYCGDNKAAKELTLDHILPRAQGGTTTPQNLVSACKKCNQRKGNRTPEQARMPLLTSQKLLRLGLDHVLLCHYAESRPEWKKYLFMDEFVDDEQKIAA